MDQRNSFSGFFSQLTVVGLLTLFLIISLVAMFSTAEVGEMEWVGMTVQPLGADAAAARGMSMNTGPVVEDVEGLAARAGVLAGDVLLAINNHRIIDMNDFADVTARIDIAKGGAQLDVIRNGTRMPILVFATPAHATAPGQTTPGGAWPVQTNLDQRWLGVEVETLLAGEGVELGIPAGVAGVVIDTIVPGSRAEQAGILANDVVVAVNGQRVESTVGLWTTLAGARDGGQIEVGFYRNGQLNSVTLPSVSATAVGGFFGRGGGQRLGRGGGQGLGPGGTLVCPNCRTTITHQRGVPCVTTSCPACGTQMMRRQ